MTLGGVSPGDIVLAERNGRRFYAIVIARRERELDVEPIDRRVTYHRVKAREVVGIWRQEPGHDRTQCRNDHGGGTTEHASGNGRSGGSLERLVIVWVEDTIEPQLTEQTGGRYQSPPQTHEQAMALVRLLLGHPVDQDGEREWTAPIAGGRRVVTVSEETRR